MDTRNKLIKLPKIKMEDDEARNKTITKIENPNTPIEERDRLMFQLNLYDIEMGYKKEIK